MMNTCRIYPFEEILSCSIVYLCILLFFYLYKYWEDACMHSSAT